MSDILCNYRDRESALMAYLYDDITSEERAAFETHLTTCARCRVELNGFSAVRTKLALWQVESQKSKVESLVPSAQSLVPSQESPATSWSRIPVWTQFAAAVLVLGVAAGAANLNVHYDAQSGLNVRTGWMSATVPTGPAAQPAPILADAASRAELTTLEQQLRAEIRAISANTTPRASVASDGEVLRRVRGMLDETERRHERELALRVAEVIRDVNAQRQADLVKIDQNLNQGRVEVLRNRQMLDYYMQRVSRPQ